MAILGRWRRSGIGGDVVMVTSCNGESATASPPGRYFAPEES